MDPSFPVSLTHTRKNGEPFPWECANQDYQNLNLVEVCWYGIPRNFLESTIWILGTINDVEGTTQVSSTLEGRGRGVCVCVFTT